MCKPGRQQLRSSSSCSAVGSSSPHRRHPPHPQHLQTALRAAVAAAAAAAHHHRPPRQPSWRLRSARAGAISLRQGGDSRASGGGGGTCAPPQQLARVQVIPPRRHCRPHPHTMQRSAERRAASRDKQCGPCALTAAIGLVCALDEMCRGCRIQLSVRGVPRLLFAHSIAAMRLVRPTGCSNQRPNQQTVNGCQGKPKAAITFRFGRAFQQKTGWPPYSLYRGPAPATGP